MKGPTNRRLRKDQGIVLLQGIAKIKVADQGISDV